MYLCIIYFQIFIILKVLLKIQWIFVILLSLFAIRNFRGTYSSVEVLNGQWRTQKIVMGGGSFTGIW